MKKALYCSLALLVLGGASVRADDPPAKPASPAEQLKADPNNVEALKALMSERLARALRLMQADPEGAEKELNELKAVLDTLEPDQAAAKQLLTRAKAAVPIYLERLELARTSLEELQDKLDKAPNDARLIERYAAKAASEAATLVYSDPEKADAMIQRVKSFLDALKAKSPDGKSEAVDKAVQRFARLEDTLKAALTRARLVGQKAAPMEIETWLNGSPLAPEDLKGKVVLLDFWAVWCGPCIATFPHLREWNAKYADKGLVIVGLTRYYNYHWDDEKGQHVRSNETVAHPTEQAMLGKFAEKHKLTHRFAIPKDDSLSKFYGVTGIPQAVLIDREGTIRLIKVGSGEANAKAIGDLLESLLGTTTTTNSSR